MKNQLKAGDKIRFLNAVGGGRVTRIERGLAYVEDENGFEIPTPVHECVVVQEEDTFIPAYKSPKIEPKPHVPTSGQPKVTKADFSVRSEHSEMTPEPKLPHTYLPGGNKLNVYLAFVSTDLKKLGQSSFLAYIVNDSNYILHFVYMNRTEGNRWHLRHAETVEPNMKVLIEQFEATRLNDLEHIAIQIVAYQTDRTFDLKKPVNIEHALDTVKFFKLHSFTENDFFDEPAMLLPLIEDDRPMGMKKNDAEKIEQALKQKKHMASTPARKPDAKKIRGEHIIEVDLHAAELLDSTRGMEAKDILEYQLSKFREVMDRELKHHGQKIVFIHGKGEGVLRRAVEQELKRKYPQCRFQDASFREYGFGATMVTVK